MSVPSPFRFPVSDLLAGGERRAVTVDAAIDWSLELSRLGSALHAELTLEGASGGILVRGWAATEATHSCHRCLDEWTEPVRVDITEVIGLDADPDGYPLDDDVADLEAPLRDAVMLAVPLSPTCREGCRGLCATCGADLNTGACPGHDEEGDSPFASLRELFDS